MVKNINMKKICCGDKVSVKYTGKLKSGYIFDENSYDNPLIFTVGKNEMIKGFENAVIDMQIGEKKIVEVPPELAYGMPLPELVITLNKKIFPAEIMPEIGMLIALGKMSDDDEDQRVPIQAIITDIDGDNITIDANAPLAGETLIFEIEILNIL